MDSEKCNSTLASGSIAGILNLISSDELYASNRVRDWYIDGYNIVISKKGGIALVGAHSEGFGTGEAYIFKLTSSGWKLDCKLEVPKELYVEDFGYSVDIDTEEKTFVVASNISDHTGKQNKAAAHIYKDIAGRLVLIKSIVAEEYNLPKHQFAVVNVSNDGKMVKLWTEQNTYVANL